MQKIAIILAAYLSKSILFKSVYFYRWWFYKHYLRRQILYTSSKTDGWDRWALISMHLFWNRISLLTTIPKLEQPHLFCKQSCTFLLWLQLALSLNLQISFVALFPVMSKSCINTVVWLHILCLSDEQHLPTSEYLWIWRLFFSYWIPSSTSICMTLCLETILETHFLINADILSL